MNKQTSEWLKRNLYNIQVKDNVITTTKTISKDETFQMTIEENSKLKNKMPYIKLELTSKKEELSKISLHLKHNYIYASYETTEGNFYETDNNMKRSFELDMDDNMVEMFENSKHEYNTGLSLYSKEKKYTENSFDENIINNKIVEIVLSERTEELLDYVVETLSSYEPLLVKNLLDIYVLYREIKNCDIRSNCEDIELLINEECNIPKEIKVKIYR